VIEEIVTSPAIGCREWRDAFIPAMYRGAAGELRMSTNDRGYQSFAFRPRCQGGWWTVKRDDVSFF
jgi:hypothetical protein